MSVRRRPSPPTKRKTQPWVGRMSPNSDCSSSARNSAKRASEAMSSRPGSGIQSGFLGSADISSGSLIRSPGQGTLQGCLTNCTRRPGGPRMDTETNRKWWTLGAVCVATFMLLLDITVVNTALPAIQQDLGGSFTDLQWVIDAY